eukprot:TRINITY_DN12827_c0_g1_i1.p1 TRINITY_DN12827_c0_g1~~TRINITY_DN12827_c0_g1_i1.p1  ORF type:complete len:399 (-),score=42.02 TRINITY_DN12827_c0_g1_i1:126-1322(-)
MNLIWKSLQKCSRQNSLSQLSRRAYGTEFQKAFGLIFDKKKLTAVQKFLRYLNRKKNQKKMLIYTLGVIGLPLGFLMLPGDKILFQREFKLYASKLYLDCYWAIAGYFNSSAQKKRYTQRILRLFFMLANNDIVDDTFTAEAINRISQALHETSQFDKNSIFDALFTVNAIIKYVAKHNLDSFLKEELHDSLLSFVDMVLLNATKEQIQSNSSVEAVEKIVDKQTYYYRVESVEETLNIFQILLTYARNRDFKVQSFGYLEKWFELTSNLHFDSQADFCSNPQNLGVLLENTFSGDRELVRVCLNLWSLLIKNAECSPKIIQMKLLSTCLEYLDLKDEKIHNAFIQLLKNSRSSVWHNQQDSVIVEEKKKLIALLKKNVDTETKSTLQDLIKSFDKSK